VDVSDEAQLLVYILVFWCEGAAVDETFKYKQLPEHTKGEDIFKILHNLIKLEIHVHLQWEWCVSVSTDGVLQCQAKKRSCCPYSRH
jgi:hypothetical protein